MQDKKPFFHAQLVMVTVLVRSDRQCHSLRPVSPRVVCPQPPPARHPRRGCGGWVERPVTLSGPLSRPLFHCHSTLDQNEDLAQPGIIPPSSLPYFKVVNGEKNNKKEKSKVYKKKYKMEGGGQNFACFPYMAALGWLQRTRSEILRVTHEFSKQVHYRTFLQR